MISPEKGEEACSEIATNIPVSSRRANVCVVGHSFGPGDVGKKFHANGVVLEITGETKPCGRMDEVAPGLRKALEKDWRGGVTCRVVSGGVIEQNHVASIGD